MKKRFEMLMAFDLGEELLKANDSIIGIEEKKVLKKKKVVKFALPEEERKAM